MEDKNGVRRESLSYPSIEVAFNILRYISCEGRLNVVYGYHFMLFHELIYQSNLPLNHILNVPYFLLQSIKDMSQKNREGKHQHLTHHGLIKLIVEDSLNHIRIHVPWSKFKDMDREVVIGTHSINPRETPVSSIEGRDTISEEEEVERTT